jgi:hypothetical protein
MRSTLVNVVQSAAITAAVFVVLAAIGYAFVFVSADPTAIQLERDGSDLVRAQPWLLALLYVWVAASLVLVGRQPSR